MPRRCGGILIRVDNTGSKLSDVIRPRAESRWVDKADWRSGVH
jgi:hypothetical protein